MFLFQLFEQTVWRDEHPAEQHDIFYQYMVKGRTAQFSNKLILVTEQKPVPILNYIDCMFGVIVMLQIKFGANHMLS